jgi:prefoldin subunit 2
MASKVPPPPEVIRKYNELAQESQRLTQKIAELDFDKNEHRLVEDTLKPLEGKRRAYRLVGEVLVERTVDEVLPSVSSNREKVRGVPLLRLALYYCDGRV